MPASVTPVSLYSRGRGGALTGCLALHSGRGYGFSAPGTLGTSKTISPSSLAGTAGPHPIAPGIARETTTINSRDARIASHSTQPGTGGTRLLPHCRQVAFPRYDRSAPVLAPIRPSASSGSLATPASTGTPSRIQCSSWEDLPRDFFSDSTSTLAETEAPADDPAILDRRSEGSHLAPGV